MSLIARLMDKKNRPDISNRPKKEKHLKDAGSSDGNLFNGAYTNGIQDL